MTHVSCSIGMEHPDALLVCFAEAPDSSFVQRMHLLIGAQILEAEDALPCGWDAATALRKRSIVCTEVADIALIAGNTMQTASHHSLDADNNFRDFRCLLGQLLQRSESVEEECCVCFDTFTTCFFPFTCNHYICVNCAHRVRECPMCRCNVPL